MSGSKGLIGWRLVRMLVTVLLVAAFTYLLLDLIPGNPAFSILPSNELTPANVARVDHELGLDKPLFERMGLWALHVLQGNLGQSFVSHQSVASLIGQRLPETIELTLLAQVLAMVLALGVALLSTARKRKVLNQSTTLLTVVFISLPNFALALMVVFVFAVTLHLLPANGYVPLSQSLVGNLESMALPVFSLAAGVAAVYAQVLSAELAKTMQQDFIQFAIAKGLPRRTVLLRHALRPSSLPLVTLAAINTGVLLGGSFIIETIFALPGIGDLAVNAIYDKDYLVVQGVVLFVTVAYVVVNFLVDILYSFLDPRTRRTASAS